MRNESAKWKEYDMVARWCAKRRIAGDYHAGSVGDRLPDMIGGDVFAEIEADPDAFEQRVKDTAYMLAMESHSEPESDLSRCKEWRKPWPNYGF